MTEAKPNETHALGDLQHDIDGVLVPCPGDDCTHSIALYVGECGQCGQEIDESETLVSVTPKQVAR